jgi:hypothetical protein
VFSLTPEQILVIAILPVWFLFPLGLLVSIIIQSNEAKAPKVMAIATANEIAHSPLYTEVLDNEDFEEREIDETLKKDYQIPKNDQNSDKHWPSV